MGLRRPVERLHIDTKRRDWYLVSVDTLRAWAVVLVLAVLVAGGFFGYRAWERNDLERRAASTLRDARTLLSRLQGDDVLEAYRSQYQSALESLNAATTAFSGRHFVVALDQAQQSHKLLQVILDASGSHQGGAGQAQFISVQGRVEFRRGEGGEWQDARPRVVLYTGDHVKTGANGSAEIVFSDGTLYTARPDTQLVVFRTRTGAGLPGEQAIRMDYGWVNLNTSKRGSKVSVPEAEARVEGDSEATVTYDAGSKTARFAAIRGGMKVDSVSGEHREVGELEQVVHAGGKLSEPEQLPAAPVLLAPDDNSELLPRADPADGPLLAGRGLGRELLARGLVAPPVRRQPDRSPRPQDHRGHPRSARRRLLLLARGGGHRQGRARTLERGPRLPRLELPARQELERRRAAEAGARGDQSVR